LGKSENGVKENKSERHLKEDSKDQKVKIQFVGSSHNEANLFDDQKNF
jgi:hypothetical protein